MLIQVVQGDWGGRGGKGGAEVWAKVRGAEGGCLRGREGGCKGGGKGC